MTNSNNEAGRRFPANWSTAQVRDAINGGGSGVSQRQLMACRRNGVGGGRPAKIVWVRTNRGALVAVRKNVVIEGVPHPEMVDGQLQFIFERRIYVCKPNHARDWPGIGSFDFVALPTSASSLVRAYMANVDREPTTPTTSHNVGATPLPSPSTYQREILAPIQYAPAPQPMGAPSAQPSQPMRAGVISPPEDFEPMFHPQPFIPSWPGLDQDQLDALNFDRSSIELQDSSERHHKACGWTMEQEWQAVGDDMAAYAAIRAQVLRERGAGAAVRLDHWIAYGRHRGIFAPCAPTWVAITDARYRQGLA